ncbi:MAG: carbohydrate binding domain-containing protein, partial [Phycisphaerales bacterium]
ISEWINNWYLKTVGGGGNPLARRPDPEDGAMLEATWVNLKWRPGHYAVSHDVYIGDNFEDVDSGAAHTFVGNTPQASQIVGFVGFPFPDGLVPGTTYYWRIDEVNDANVASPWKGNVWSFWVPSKNAYDPGPADGVGVVLTNATLSWATGFGGKLGHVYFGKDAAEVEAGAGTTYKGPVVATTYDPGLLEEGTTYYWRVDQFDGVETHKGDVWSLTTVPNVAVTDPSLLGWWTLDEGGGTTAVDWSGRGNHGALIGGLEWADGYQGGALEFGVGRYVDCGTGAAEEVAADFTLAAWAKLAPVTVGNYGGIGGRLMYDGTNYFGFAVVRHSSNVYRLWVGDGTADLAKSAASSDVMYTDTEWHHVAGVREGRTNALYIDGVRQASTTLTDFVPSQQFFYIGRQYSTQTDRTFVGLIDDVRLYNKALTADQIAEVMLGNTKTAGNPVPDRDALLDIRDISSLGWSRGSTAASHDVYLGQDRDTVAGADNDAPEFQGNQTGTSLSLASLVEFGGGDYYWRVDEVEAGGTVHAGTIWKFTVPDYLIVDNFESYNNVDPPNTDSNRVFDNWIDGYGTTTNGALVGNDVPPYGEHSVVKSGNQSLVYAYDNAGKTSEATLTLTKGDWTVEGVTKLSLWLRGASANAPDKIYVALNGTAVVYHDDASATQMKGWNQWVIDLSAFGIGLTNVNSITIGIGTKNAPSPAGGTGTMYFDDIAVGNPVVRKAPVNLLTNGGFEDGVIDPWEYWGDVSAEVVQDLVGAAVPEDPIEGDSCLHITVNSPGANNWDYAMIQRGRVFEAGKKYTFSAFLKTREGTMEIRLKPERDADPWEGHGDQVLTITDQWTEYSVTTPVIPADVDPAATTFHFAFGPGEFWVDGVRFYEGEPFTPPPAGAIVLGDFEGGLDGWFERDATLSLSPTGATVGTGALQIDGPGDWHINTLLDLKPHRVAFGQPGATITADVTVFDADLTTTWMNVEMVINAQNNDDAGPNNNIGWQSLGAQDVVRDGQPQTLTWALPESLTTAISGVDDNISWFELALVSNLDGASVTKFYVDNILLVVPAP